MNPVWKKIKEYAKTIAVFLAGVMGPPLLRLFTGEDPFPQDKQQWINWLGAIAVSTVAAWLTKNKITQKQLDTDPYVVGGTVVDDLPPIKDTNYNPNPGSAWPKR